MPVGWLIARWVALPDRDGGTFPIYYEGYRSRHHVAGAGVQGIGAELLVVSKLLERL